jgi:hypothetical protein
MDKVCVLLCDYYWFLTGGTSMLDLLEDFMQLRKLPYARLDGSTNRPRRNLDIRLVSNVRLIDVTHSNCPPSSNKRNRVRLC